MHTGFWWGEHVAHMGARTDAYTLLVGRTCNTYGSQDWCLQAFGG